MLDFNIEWLFEEAYRIKRDSTKKAPYFLSNWDVDGAKLAIVDKLVSEIHSNASTQSSLYNYSFEQFDLKDEIRGLLQNQFSVEIFESEITICPSATSSIYLVIESLAQLTNKRLLITTPIYFSVHESLRRQSFSTFFYHLNDHNNYKIDYHEFERIIIDQFIQVIYITDPIYSAGVGLSKSDYIVLTEICNRNGVYFIVDYCLGGLDWNKVNDFTFDSEKMNTIKSCNKFGLIDSLSKKLFLNGIKFSLVIGNEALINGIDLLSESVYGGLNSIQCHSIKKFYEHKNQTAIDILCLSNSSKIQDNYRLVSSYLIGTDFNISKANSGYFAVITHKKILAKQIDSRAFSLSLLQELNILVLTNDRLSFSSENHFGFRINLTNEIENLIFHIGECIGIDYSRFYKGK